MKVTTENRDRVVANIAKATLAVNKGQVYTPDTYKDRVAFLGDNGHIVSLTGEDLLKCEVGENNIFIPNEGCFVLFSGNYQNPLE